MKKGSASIFIFNQILMVKALLGYYNKEWHYYIFQLFGAIVMSGLIIADRQSMSEEENRRYKAYRCGLCRALKDVAGIRGQALLSYDMTFLYILLSGLYEDESEEQLLNCPVHPFVKHPTFSDETAVYAAEMNILLCYSSLLCGMHLKSSHEKKYLNALHDTVKSLSKKYPRQASACKKAVNQVLDLERRNEENEQFAAGALGEALGQAFVMREDEFQKDLYDTGFYLGKFTYLMRSHVNLSEDKKNGNYNPLILKEERDPEGYSTCVRVTLKSLINESIKSFERLPIQRDASIIRNVLASGVWQIYETTAQKQEKQQGFARQFFM